MHVLAFIFGLALWAGATALLISDAWTSGHLTIIHALQPLLTAGTVAAAVYAHKARWLMKPGFVALAVLGTVATIYGTLGRTADVRDARLGEAMRSNRALEAKQSELTEAKKSAAVECRLIGPRCQLWQSRVDALTREASAMAVVALDPRADALARLATLLSFDGVSVRTLVEAVDPIVLPIFLEFGSILFFAAAFPRKRSTVAANPEATVPNTEATLNSCARIWTQAEALHDFRQMREVGAQRFLAERYGVDKSTVSRWLKDWETEGHIRRERDGKSKQVSMVALPAIATPVHGARSAAPHHRGRTDRLACDRTGQ